MGNIRLRDFVIAVLIVGLLALGMFTMVSGITEKYDTDNTSDELENVLQDNQEVIDHIEGLQNKTKGAKNIIDYGSLFFSGIMAVGLVILSIFTNIHAMIMIAGSYFGLGGFATYIALMILVSIIFTVWKVWQGRDAV